MNNSGNGTLQTDGRVSTRVSKESFFSTINDILATRITMWVGTIWAFYAFLIFGLTPLIWPNYEEQILYWSNFLQLVFLPIITVGTAIKSRGLEVQQDEDHEIIRKEFELLQEAHRRFTHSLNEIGGGVQELLRRSDQGPPSAPST